MHLIYQVFYLSAARDLALEQQMNFGDDITSQLRLAKKRRFAQQEEIRLSQEIELQMYLNRLIREDRDRQIEKITEDKAPLDEHISTVENKAVSINLCNCGIFFLNNQLFSNQDEYMKQLGEMFSQVDERRMAREVPDYLCGKISFEIMKDPVITPSGITYDRKDIEEHLQVILSR